MIHNKIKKGHASQLLVQFSRQQSQWPQVISKFYNTCKQEQIKTNKSSFLKGNMLRFYSVNQINQQTSNLVDNNQMNNDKLNSLNKSQLNISNVLKSRVTQIKLKYTLVYMNDQYDEKKPISYQQFISRQSPKPRVLLLRQTLKPYYDINFDIESTLSQQQSSMFLCEMSASIINSKHDQDIEQYHQKKQLMIRRGNQGQLNQKQVLWRNILFQLPGLGKDKVKSITFNYPSYIKILKDSDKQKKLKNVIVGKGTKLVKIGSCVADRIYKVFGSTDGNQKLY